MAKKTRQMILEIRHGWLLDVVGSPVCADGIWLVPVCGDVDEPEEFRTYPYADIAGRPHMPELIDLVNPDGLWVRSAIQNSFRFSPVSVADRRAFVFDSVFMAVVPEGGERLVAYPFLCTENSFSPCLVFSRHGPSVELQARISRIFWNVLITNAAAGLSDFMVPDLDFDGGDGYSSALLVGCSSGHFFAVSLTDILDEEDQSDRYDLHVSSMCGVTPNCPDCDGSGEESFLPAGEICDHCHGTGMIWEP